MGSVKDLIVIEKPCKNKSGKGRFIFSDRYSVFDWGEMPDHIPDKGKSLCIPAAYFFEKLENMGTKTHYFGLVEDNETKKFADLKRPADTMEVKLVRVLKPPQKGSAYDYSIYGGLKGKVTVISPDTIRDEVKQDQFYYRVYIRTDSDKLHNKAGKEFGITPGMVATVDIKTGQKTIMDYLLKPFNKAKEALRER